MSEYRFVQDPAVSIARGLPLAEEPGLGALTLCGFIREVTDRFAEREALTQMRISGTMERWSYRDLWQRSMDVAKALIACRLGKGERVGVLMTNRAEFLSAVFGTALAGGVATPLSTFCTPRELEQLLTDSACSVLLLEGHVANRNFTQMMCELEPLIASSTPGQLESERFPFLQYLAVVDETTSIGAIEPWEDFLARGSRIAAERVDARASTILPADPGALFFSSGSTGRPKGILSSHRGVSIQMWRMRRQQGLTGTVRYWTANGFFWSGNFAMALGATLAAGGTLVLQRMFQPEQALTLICAERVNFLFAWPHQWAQLESAKNWHTVDLSTLTYIDVDSPIARHPTVRTHWIEPRHCYGNTETFTLSTAYPANTTREEANSSHGLPLPGNSLKIVDPLTGRAVPVGERGEIAVKGPTLMLGYLGKPLDETLDDEGYFLTGDAGYMDQYGRLYWQGRLNDIIKTGGANVSPLEIDEIIRTCPGVKLTQTVGVPHDTLGEIVVSCVVTHDGQILDEQAVRAFARDKLASYKIPRRVLFFPDGKLQLTGSAKVKTGDLRQLAAKMLAGEIHERRSE